MAQGPMRTKEAAKTLGISEYRVRQLIKHGELRAINAGGHGKHARWVVEPEDLKAFKRARQNRARDLIAT